MKKQFFIFFLGATILATHPAFAMEEELTEQDLAAGPSSAAVSSTSKEITIRLISSSPWCSS